MSIIIISAHSSITGWCSGFLHYEIGFLCIYAYKFVYCIDIYLFITGTNSVNMTCSLGGRELLR